VRTQDQQQVQFKRSFTRAIKAAAAAAAASAASVLQLILIEAEVRRCRPFSLEKLEMA
jgi:hypothetical protein